MQRMTRQRLIKLYIWAVVVAGAAACLDAALRLPLARLDLKFFFIALATVTLASRVTVRIPGITSAVTVSDTFVFLVMLLYGGEAAVLVAAAEALCCSSQRGTRARTQILNAALLACSTYLTAQVWQHFHGRDGALELTGGYIVTLLLMVFVQFAVNSGLASVYEALKAGETAWAIWRKSFLWTLITYLAGASGGAIIAQLIEAMGFNAFLLTLPIIGTIYFTHRAHLKQIEAAEAQAVQARRHVEELSHYIAEQERIREQFVQVEKMSALGQLASGVAHDFNNCLATILGRAELMARRADDPKVKQGLEIIIKSAHGGAHTVRRIQDFARQRRERDFQPVVIDQLLSDVSEMTRPRWKDGAEASGASVRLELKNRSRAVVLGDDSELRDVLVNMVFNAVDAMPTGGTLALTASVTGEVVSVQVSDTGEGMPPEVRTRVFDPFFTTKGLSGMGLGLAVSYGIVCRHGGRIGVESEIGRGTTFTITLPLSAITKASATQNEDDESVDESAVSPWRYKRMRILVVDDEDPVREILCDILEEEGYQTTQARGGAEALALLDAADFDAVFTDIGMPGMSGWELARAVRARDSLIPLAVITGWGESVSGGDKEAARVNWVLTKPFTITQISQIAEEVAHLRQEQRGILEQHGVVPLAALVA
jgi:signal transduction histidine kinase/ActR/RegA family two-component response regulator